MRFQQSDKFGRNSYFKLIADEGEIAGGSLEVDDAKFICRLCVANYGVSVWLKAPGGVLVRGVETQK